MIKLRKFFLSDLNKLIKIERASFPDRIAWSKKYFKRIYLQYPEEFIIAENKKEIVGYTAGELKNNSGEIISLAVEPKWRRRKIGKRLINFLINHFKERGIKEISLCVRTKNRAGIAFYQKLGFEILKTVENYYRNGDDAYLMRKKNLRFLNLYGAPAP